MTAVFTNAYLKLDRLSRLTDRRFGRTYRSLTIQRERERERVYYAIHEFGIR